MNALDSELSTCFFIFGYKKEALSGEQLIPFLFCYPQNLWILLIVIGLQYDHRRATNTKGLFVDMNNTLTHNLSRHYSCQLTSNRCILAIYVI